LLRDYVYTSFVESITVDPQGSGMDGSYCRDLQLAVDDILTFISSFVLPLPPTTSTPTNPTSSLQSSASFLVDYLGQKGLGPSEGHVGVESSVFAYVYPHMFHLYIQANSRQDNTIYLNSKALNLLPLSQQLTVLELTHMLPPEKEGNNLEQVEEIPFADAVSVLKGLAHCDSCLKKLNCLKLTAKHIESTLSSLLSSFGADEFLPVFCFVVAQSELRFLQSENNFLSDFMDESWGLNIFGYLFAQFQVAVNELLHLHEKNALFKQLTSTTSNSSFPPQHQ